MEKDFYKTYFTLEESNWWFRVRRNLVLDLLQKYKVSKTEKIFDFGCGSGYTVGYLQKLGYDVSGSDISAEAIKFGLSRGILNLTVVQSVPTGASGNDEIRPAEDGFDLILVLDAIEHIQDDSGAIKALERALRPGGMIIITVPAYQWLWGVQDEVAHHYRRYTKKSVLALVRNSRANLSIIRSTYFNTFLFGPVAVVRLLSRMFSLKSRESDFDLSSSFLNKILYGIFNLEAKLLRVINFPFGVSMLLVLKKN